ncbi:hypothetical protein C1752_02733 [Acaryochloris thomasi RCC1774]|uniref:Type II secretion system protein GspC N-terminal domain-containing protein n=1 Tax=Acaryochloris thomasi RCC1774 TaxID=1764569 RepID=A0A2W1JW98_9CYAN|nr:hypothetical protein [Acaryochloris thomasi]PZD73001.1 hypothetical protein C1752_02733 [Acaryochloris thomasi RCC1774]
MSDNFGLDVTVSTEPSLSNDAILETSASELMDELFAQLDNKLRDGETSGQKTSSSLSTRVRPRQALSVLESSDLEVSYTPIEAALTPRQIPEWQLSLDETIGIGNPQDSKFNQRLFVCIALTSVGAALVWIGTQLAPRPVTAPIIAEATTQSLPINSADVQFAASMTQSLQKIDSKKPTLPTAVPPVQAPTPQTPSKALNKPTLPTISSVQAAAPKLPATIPASVTPARIPAKQEPLPVKSAPQAASATTELPQVQPEAQPSATQTVAVAKPAPLTDVSKAAQTLVGVLEFGDQSVALVENNGATRRVEIGEILNDSGWVLAAVENGQAIIKRSGQVRALDPDQKF